MTRVVFICALLFASLAPRPALAAGPLQRFALVIGANAGGADRPRLQYAISDAERFARVLTDIGGVPAGNAVLLRQPKLRELLDALDALTRRVTEARRLAGASGGRTEVVLYYSGHADEQGLLLGDDRFGYRSLRERLDLMPADVRIAVLDACSSGAFTRIKGGKTRPPFLVDESADMRGHAFLTSSAATEAAQESDRIRASYFTHYLISGFRGAADLSGDGKVTLSEAYQFAFNETLGKTVDTKGGAQHPSYDINLSGTGDVVMTDVRQTTATLVLDEELEGRFFVRTSSQELIVELYKPAGRRVELAIEPGSYDVRMERAKGSFAAKAIVADGARVVMDLRQFGTAAPAEITARRGSEPSMRYAVGARNRVALLMGMWRSRGSGVATVGTTVDAFGGLEYTRFVREDLAVTFSMEGFGAQEGTSVGAAGVATGSSAGFATPLGIRWNPLARHHQPDAIKPFVLVAGGPILGAAEGTLVSRNNRVSTGEGVRGTFGARLGGGFDLHVSRSFSLGLMIAYNVMPDFSEPVGLRDNFNGPQVGVAFGWVFGKGAQP